MKDFAKSYLAAQGVVILSPSRRTSTIVKKKEPEFVPVVPQCERGDI